MTERSLAWAQEAARARHSAQAQGHGSRVTCILGADPGSTTGLCWIGSAGEVLVFQCNAPAARLLASWLLESAEEGTRVIAGGERFVAGRGAGARGAEAAATRQVIDALDQLGGWHWRMAAEVKPWATDRRLAAAGLLAQCHGMPHAADACRHALFAAVHDGGYPDPLSRRAGTLHARALTPAELEGQ